jgi:hypothetical protein
MNKELVLGFARHLLTFGGGYIAAKGIIDQGMVNEAVGAIMTLAGLAWSAADKKKRVK